MKKFLALIFATFMVLSLAACGEAKPAQSTAEVNPAVQAAPSAEEPIVMKVTTTLASTSFAGISLTDYLKPYIEEHSNGRIKVEVYCDGILGTERELIEALQLNTIQADIAPANSLSNFDPKLGAAVLPYLFKDRYMAYEHLDGEFGEYLAKDLPEKAGIRVMVWSESAVRCLANSKRPIHTPDDMKGLKFRVMETTVDMAIIEALGASPVPMNFNELYTGLQQGVVDGNDNGLIMTYTNKLYEVQPYFTVSNQYFLSNTICVSEDWYQSLPDDLKQVVEDGCKYAFYSGRELIEKQEAEFIPIMEAAGCEIYYPTDEEIALFKEATDSVWDIAEDIVQDPAAFQMAKDIKASW